MSNNPLPTQITVMLKPEHEDHALYLIGAIFTSALFTIISTRNEQVMLGTVFTLMHREKHVTLELSAPITNKEIDDIADLVKTGLILGFVVRGDIDLGGEHVFTNLAPIESRGY